MSRADAWMPLYIGDYLGDTMALEAREHGAYLLLIMHYWRNGPLPDDDRALAGIARVDRAMWLADTGPIVRAFFTARDGKLHHKRIDQEREAAAEVSDARRAAANARWGKDKAAKTNGGNDPGAAPASDAYAYAENAATDDRTSTSDASAMHMHPNEPETVHTECIRNANASDVHMPGISPSPSQKERKKEGSLRSPTRAQAIPDDWKPTDEDQRYAIGHGIDPDRAAEEFVNHWANVRGRGAAKASWSRAFRNRVLVLEDQQRFLLNGRKRGEKVSVHQQIHQDLGTTSMLAQMWEDDADTHSSRPTVLQ